MKLPMSFSQPNILLVQSCNLSIEHRDMSFLNIALLLALLALVNSKVYKPRRGISKAQAFEEYNTFWNKTHKSTTEKNARYLNFLSNAKKIAHSNKKQ